MGYYNIDRLIVDVRTTLDINPTVGSLLPNKNPSTLSLNELIRSKIQGAIQWVVREAPYHKLGSGKSFKGSIAWDGQVVGVGSGRIALPHNFLRLVCFEMSDWQRPATTPISDDDPRYAMQVSRYPGIKGNPQSPVVAIINEPIGLVLQFFSCEAGERVFIKKANYIPLPQVLAQDHEVEIPDKLYQAVLYHIAYLTSVSLGDNDKAGIFLNISKEYLQ